MGCRRGALHAHAGSRSDAARGDAVKAGDPQIAGLLDQAALLPLIGIDRVPFMMVGTRLWLSGWCVHAFGPHRGAQQEANGHTPDKAKASDSEDAHGAPPAVRSAYRSSIVTPDSGVHSGASRWKCIGLAHPRLTQAPSSTRVGRPPISLDAAVGPPWNAMSLAMADDGTSVRGYAGFMRFMGPHCIATKNCAQWARSFLLLLRYLFMRVG